MSIQDLDRRFPIVNEDGTPTDYFMRLLRDRGSAQTDVEETAAETAASVETLSTTVANLGLDDLTDVDTATTPPTDGQALVWVDADSEWAPGDVASGGGGGGTPFSGALVRKVADQTALNATGTVTLTWDSEVYDIGDWHDTAVNNERFTIPEGVTKVRIGVGVNLSSVSAGVDVALNLRKNGLAFDGYIGQSGDADSTSPRQAFWSPVIEVVAGDYFDARLFVATDTSITVVADGSWFAIEAVEISSVSSEAQGVSVSRVAAQSVATATDTAVIFDTSTRNTDGMWVAGTPTEIEISTTGWYNISGFVSYFTSVSALYYARIRVNGSLIGTFLGPVVTSSSTDTTIQFCLNHYLTAGDVITVEARHTAGVNRDVKALATVTSLAGPASPSGIAFPTSPASGDRYFRTDRGIEYYWDGTRWLSVDLHWLDLAQITNTAGTFEFYSAVPYKGTYSIWLEHVESSSLRVAAGEWDIVVGWRPAANTVNVLTTIDGNGDASGTWVSKTATLDALLDSTAEIITCSISEISGATTFYGNARLWYRLVG